MTQVSPQPVETLPRAIWMPGPVIYRGAPLDMVRRMAREMDVALLPREAIQILSLALRYGRGVRLRLKWSAPDDELARQFISALLTHKIGQAMSAA